MSLIHKSVAACTAFALCDVIRGLFFGNALLDHIQNRRLARPGIFQFPELLSGKHRQALRLALRYGQNQFVGQTSQAKGLRLPGPQAQLIEARQFQHRLFGGSRGKQIRDGLPVRKGFMAAARNPDQGDARRIGKTGLTRLFEFADFSVGNIQGSKLSDIVEPHARLIELFRAGRLCALARRQYHQER